MRLAACVALLLAFSGLAAGQIIAIEGDTSISASGGGGGGGGGELPMPTMGDVGAACTSGSQCFTNLCLSERCAYPAMSDSTQTCSASVACPQGQECRNGLCASSEMPMPPMDGGGGGSASADADFSFTKCSLTSPCTKAGQSCMPLMGYCTTAGEFGTVCSAAVACATGYSCINGLCHLPAGTPATTPTDDQEAPSVCATSATCGTDGVCSFAMGTTPHGYCTKTGGPGAPCTADSACSSAAFESDLIGAKCSNGFCVPVIPDISQWPMCKCMCNGAAIPVPATPMPDCTACPISCGFISGMSCSRVDGYVPGTFVPADKTGTVGSTCAAPAPPTACAVTMDCPRGQQCRDRVCKPFDILSNDCKSEDGASVCAATEECFFGVCVPARPKVACDPPCRTASGEVCNSNLGRCVMDQAAAPLNCAELCDGGACRPPLFPGMPVTCAGTTTCADNSACGAGNKCVQGYCSACGALCSAVSDSLFAELFNSGFRADSFSVRNASDVAAAIADGALSVAANVLMQLDQAMGGLRQLDFNAAGGAAAQVQSGQQIRLEGITAAVAGGRLLVGAGAQLRSNLTVSSAAGFTLSMVGAAGERALSQFNRLDLSGPLNVAGDENSEFAFPSAAGQSTAQGSGIVQLTGGMRLRGHAGAIPISLGAGDSSAVVDTELVAQGSVLGERATLVVRGLVAFSGALVEPLVRLHQGATASFRPPAAGALMAGNVSFAANAAGAFSGSRLVVNGTGAAGQSVVFQHISNCPTGATIVYNVEGSADAKVRAGLTLFKYALSTFAGVDAFRCAIQVCGTDGNGCVAVANPNAPLSARRLLATSAEASFEPNQLTVSGKDAGAAASVQVGVATIAALVAAVLALIRM